MPTAEERLDQLLHAGDHGVWTTAALVRALRDSGPEAHRTAAGDVLPRVLALANTILAESPAADRVVVREQGVGALDEPDTYALAWLPAPFVPEAPLRAGIQRIRSALLPGGWLVMGHGKFGGHPVDDAVGRFKTVVFGGTALDDDEAAALLREFGFTDVRSAPTPPGAPALTAGRRPPG